MSLQMLMPPIEEPVSLVEAKNHLRVDVNDDDALIQSLISAARQFAESVTGRQIITARWKLTLDGFCDSVIWLPKCPVQSVIAIDYLGMDGMWQSMPPKTFTTDLACEPARVMPVFGQTWPVTLPQMGSVAVTFDAGYGTAAQVPDGLKSWIKMRLGSLYAHREEMAVLSKGRIDPLPFVDGLLDPYRIVTV